MSLGAGPISVKRASNHDTVARLCSLVYVRFSAVYAKFGTAGLLRPRLGARHNLPVRAFDFPSSPSHHNEAAALSGIAAQPCRTGCRARPSPGLTNVSPSRDPRSVHRWCAQSCTNGAPMHRQSTRPVFAPPLHREEPGLCLVDTSRP